MKMVRVHSKIKNIFYTLVNNKKFVFETLIQNKSNNRIVLQL